MRLLDGAFTMMGGSFDSPEGSFLYYSKPERFVPHFVLLRGETVRNSLITKDLLNDSLQFTVR